MNEEEKNNNYAAKKKGKTFYTSVPIALTPRATITLPKIKEGVLPLAENLVLFFFGMAESLLALRLVMMILGINGGNLFTFLFYAASYPFVLLGGSSQMEIPGRTLTAGVETTMIMAVYAVIWFVLAKIIALKK